MSSHVSISTIPLPDGLSPVQRTEYSVFQSAMAEIEAEVARLQSGEGPKEGEVLKVLGEMRDKRKTQADERCRARLDIIGREVELQKDEIEKDFELAKERLYKRLVKALAKCDKGIMAELREVMGPDFREFEAQAKIRFPTQLETVFRPTYRAFEPKPLTLPVEEVVKDITSLAGSNPVVLQ